MAKKTTETDETAPPASRGKKLTIVFKGRFEALYDQIEQLAADDDRDMDTWILRHLDQTIDGQDSVPGAVD